jgi:RNAse (barnase) inhibitor barstar
MILIKIDASLYKEIDTFYESLKLAIGSPDWHGKNINAFIDSIVYGGINSVEPPYKIVISNISECPDTISSEIREDVSLLQDAISCYGRSNEIQIEISSG